MGETKVITIGRQELYDRVWSTPMTAVCRDYGISNVGLAKVCRRHKIPCPPRGYWAKKHSGKTARRTPLPVCSDLNLQTVEFHPTPPKPPEPAVVFDADVAVLLEKARALPSVLVPSALRDPHPLVAEARTRFEGAKPDVHNLVSPLWTGTPTLSVSVGSATVPRALRFLDALIKAIQKLGGRIEVREREHNHRHETVAVLCDEGVPFRLRERYRQVPKPPGDRKGLAWSSYEYPLTGEFVLDRGPDYLDRAYAQDTTAAGRVEDQLNEVLIGMVAEAGRRRIGRREREAAHRRWEEQERLRREQAERERAERARVEKLLAEADAWKKADTLRGYVAAVEQLAVARRVRVDEGAELAAWMKWAREQADKLDPVRGTLDRLTRTPTESA